jgi:uncharacterized membrane protein YagU involved in acid resistance
MCDAKKEENSNKAKKELLSLFGLYSFAFYVVFCFLFILVVDKFRYCYPWLLIMFSVFVVIFPSVVVIFSMTKICKHGKEKDA